VVLIEASEESGSPDLEAYLDYLKDHLGNVELMICLDSGALTYDRLWVTTSLRGVVNVDLEIEVLSQGQHSGSASGVVPSSFRILRELLDRVEDASTGEILVPQLNAKIPDADVRAASALAEEFGDIIATRTPDPRGCGADGCERRGADPSPHVVSHALDRRTRRRAVTRDRRQRPATLDDGQALVSTAPERGRRDRARTP
jgi:acetylornithine deacetylase/succinyl-diaminopimelate desuccinylase-like protein